MKSRKELKSTVPISFESKEFDYLSASQKYFSSEMITLKLVTQPFAERHPVIFFITQH